MSDTSDLSFFYIISMNSYLCVICCIVGRYNKYDIIMISYSVILDFHFINLMYEESVMWLISVQT